ncbi:MAG: RNA-protein complex protein Nop10 [Desulfurococcaceae archaeon]
MRRCVKCKKYTIVSDKCPYCGAETEIPHPPRFSPEDKYVEYRIKAKIESNTLDLEKKPLYFID